MTKVYSEQQTVVQSFSAQIQQLGRKRNGTSQRAKNKASQLMKEISRRRAEIHELTRAAERTAEGARRSFPPSPFHQITIFRWLIYMQLKELLDIKQKHANVSEANAGVLRTEEANIILDTTRKLSEESAKQTIQGSKQNRSMMIFTIVTIIFVRISRLEIPVRDEKGKLLMRYASYYWDSSLLSLVWVLFGLDKANFRCESSFL